jgi:hypothetical protein
MGEVLDLAPIQQPEPLVEPWLLHLSDLRTFSTVTLRKMLDETIYFLTDHFLSLAQIIVHYMLKIYSRNLIYCDVFDGIFDCK